MRVKLYVIPGSHPCAAVEAALALKGIAYLRIALPPLMAAAVGMVMYGAPTVPGLVLSGVPLGRERISGSRAIMRRLDEAVAEPPLLPADPERRAAVLAAEEWGDVTLQSAVRRIAAAMFVRCPRAMPGYAGETRVVLQPPDRLVPPVASVLARGSARRNRAGEQRVRADLGELPAHLDLVDGWVDEGLLGGEAPNAADLQIGSSLALLHSFADVRPLVAMHGCAVLRRYLPPVAGRVEQGVLPPEWLAIAPGTETAPARGR